MRHVYVHVPFCRRRCSYCDFSIAVRRRVPSAAYALAVLAEHARLAASEWENEPLQTLYFGGGTPSLLEPGEFSRLVTAMATGRDHQAEITLEANPEDVTPAHAAAWADAGVTRVSLGVQSLDASVLEWMHRPHGPDAPERAMAALRGAGIASVSVDLIFALPAELHRDLGRDLEALLALNPDHISAYGLTVEERTPLARWVERGAATRADDARYAEEFLAVDAALTEAGFEHYEVSNYARPGHRSRHNGAYWSGEAYAGLGPAAHRYAAGVRSWNVAQWVAYQARLARGDDPTESREVLTPAQQELERLYLGLRTSDGVDLASFPTVRESVVGRLAAEGWLVPADSPLTLHASRLSVDGWLRLDEIVAVLTTSAQGG